MLQTKVLEFSHIFLKISQFPPSHFLFLFILQPHLHHLEVPRLACTTATAMQDLSCICDLHCSLLNPLSRARDQTLWMLHRVLNLLSHNRNSPSQILTSLLQRIVKWCGENKNPRYGRWRGRAFSDLRNQPRASLWGVVLQCFVCDHP